MGTSILGKAYKNNRFTSSIHYGRIMREYNDRLARDGKVNSKQFHTEVISGIMPEYKIGAWYAFLKKFQTPAGVLYQGNAILNTPPADAGIEEVKTARTLLSNNAATSSLVQNLLNVSAARAAELAEHPEMLTHKEAIELGLKTMKAQDSRIHAIGKIREDNREQDKFDRAFSEASNG